MSEIDQATFDELKQISGADFVGELVSAFLDDAPKLFSQLRASLESGDADAFRRAAHSLKSNCATFGALGLSDLARELEVLGKEHRLGDVGGGVDEAQRRYAQAAQELRRLQG